MPHGTNHAGFASCTALARVGKFDRVDVFVLAIVFLCCLIALVVKARSITSAWRQQVSEQLGAAKSEGLPTTAAELDAWYAQVPATNNAALYYEALGQLRVQQIPSAVLSVRRDEPLSESISNQVVMLVCSQPGDLGNFDDPGGKSRRRYQRSSFDPPSLDTRAAI
jgi:hypothetical protein